MNVPPPNSIDSRTRTLEVSLAELRPVVRQLRDDTDKHERLLATLHESMTELSNRTGSLQRWRQKDEPRIEAAAKADEFAQVVAQELSHHAERRLSRRDRVLAYSVGAVAALALGTQIAQIFYSA